MADINALNRLIEKAGAGWVARETPLSNLGADSVAEGMLGLALTDDEALNEMRQQRQVEFGAAPPSPPPPRIDWRNHNGSNWVTPVKDQKSCGSCVAFATSGAIESRVRIENNRPNATVNLSEAHLFYCGAPNACSVGWQPTKAMAFARNPGIGLEAAFPYVPGNQACQLIPPAVRISGHQSAATMLQRKRALLGGPVVAGMKVFGDFLSYGSGVYRHVDGVFVGNHAVCVVGYDDATGCWIAKNSWNTSWGENGFFRIAYGECGFDSQFTFTVPGPVQVLSGLNL